MIAYRRLKINQRKIAIWFRITEAGRVARAAHAASDRLTRPAWVRRFLRLALGDPPAQVAELVDALVSGTSGAIRGGSSPLLGTISPSAPVRGRSPRSIYQSSH